MTHKGMLEAGPLWLVLVVWLATIGIAGAADEPTLVFSDGSTIQVESATIVRGSVVVELADGRKQQFDIRDIDLEASGLVQSASQSTSAPPAKTAPKLVMPGDAAEPTGLTITDRDVGHVRPSSGASPSWDEETEDENVGSGVIPLRLSGVRRSEHDGGVTVTGTVTNDGIFDLEQTTVTGFAVDVDGKNLGQGSVGLASVLSQGASRGFSLMIPVTGEVDSVRVTASATEIRPKPRDSAAPEGSEESRNDSSEPPEPEGEPTADAG